MRMELRIQPERTLKTPKEVPATLQGGLHLAQRVRAGIVRRGEREDPTPASNLAAQTLLALADGEA